jgi:hypothetical protein
MNKNRRNNVSLVLVIAFFLIFIFINKDLKDFPEVIIAANTKYLIVAVLLMFGNWALDGIILNVLTNKIYGKVKFLKSFRFSLVGQYYSAITPFSAGGQPAQIYLMSKDSIPVSKSSLILFNKFVIYQAAVTLYYLIMFIFKFNFVSVNAKSVLPFAIFGLFLYVVVLIGITLLFYKPSWIKPIVLTLYKFLSKIKIMKNLEKYKYKIEKFVEEYEISAEKIKRNRNNNLGLFLLSTIQITFDLSVTYFVYLSMHLRKAAYLDVIAVQSIVYLVAVFMPTPGSIGASEGGYYLLFKPIFTKNLILHSLILWRAINYYLKILITGFVTFIDHLIRKILKKV